MIPQKLEEIILRGGGQYANFVHGVSGTGTLPVPKDTWIVIYNVKYFDFLDRDRAGGLTLNRMNTQITFTSKSKRYQFVARDNISRGIIEEGGVFISYLQPQGHTDFACYQIHNRDVAIDLLKMRTPSSWVAPIGTLPIPEQVPEEPVPPLGGYGNAPGGESTILEIKQDGGGVAQSYQPLGSKRMESLTPLFPFEPTLKYEFAAIGEAATALNPPDQTTDLGNFQYPILDISYVIINESPPADLIK